LSPAANKELFMNTEKVRGFAVAVLVSALASGCGAVTAGVPLGTVASGSGGMVRADSAPAYRPAAVPEVAHHSTERASGPVAPRRSFHP
jgi:hypothetical protein